MYIDNMTFKDSEHLYYPYTVVRDLGNPSIKFSNITIFYGGNGSGKSTLLNLLAAKIKSKRYAEYHENEMWIGEYVWGLDGPYWVNKNVFPIQEATSEITQVTIKDKSFLDNRMITMDDILKYINDDKDFNHEMVEKAVRMRDERNELLSTRFRDIIDDDGRFDYKELRDWCDVNNRKKTVRDYVDERIENRRKISSNGESVLAFYNKIIDYKSIYLLDEPENCLSSIFQIKLARLIDNAEKNKNCQFVIATHSPFFLSIRGTKIYNLDRLPVEEEKWYNLDNVKAYYDFFKLHKMEFEKDDGTFLNDDQYDYLIMWFKYHNAHNAFRKLQNDEVLLKKVYEYQKRNRDLTPDEVVDEILKNE